MKIKIKLISCLIFFLIFFYLTLPDLKRSLFISNQINEALDTIKQALFESKQIKEVNSSKALECLEEMAKYRIEYSEYLMPIKDLNEYKTIKQALLELKAIKESNPNEALELVYCLKDYLMNMMPYYDWLNDIEKYILNAQEQEKILELIDYALEHSDSSSFLLPDGSQHSCDMGYIEEFMDIIRGVRE